MLTVDLIRCRISRDGVLSLVGRNPKQKGRQIQLAQAMIEVVEVHQGSAREQVNRGLDAIPFQPNERKLVLGLRKLLLDQCEFEQVMMLDPEELRAMTWTLAAERWRTLGPTEIFDRGAVLEVVARRFESTVTDVEDALFGDLKSAHRLTHWSKVSAERLIEIYHSAQSQAVFLKAVRVAIEFTPSSPTELRRFFHLLKFRGLLFKVDGRKNDTVRLSLDGPVSLFSQTSRYGLKLATLIPRLPQFGTGVARAELSWGKHRKKISFEHAFTHHKSGGSGKPEQSEAIEKLVDGWTETADWSVEVVTGDLIEVSGRALVPDLVCVHRERGTKVYLELLGFWSRDAVWQRVDLASSLKHPFVFLVSDRLRVSEQALADSENAALFVFKGVINRKRLLEKLDSFL